MFTKSGRSTDRTQTVPSECQSSPDRFTTGHETTQGVMLLIFSSRRLGQSGISTTLAERLSVT